MLYLHVRSVGFYIQIKISVGRSIDMNEWLYNLKDICIFQDHQVNYKNIEQHSEYSVCVQYPWIRLNDNNFSWFINHWFTSMNVLYWFTFPFVIISAFKMLLYSVLILILYSFEVWVFIQKRLCAVRKKEKTKRARADVSGRKLSNVIGFSLHKVMRVNFVYVLLRLVYKFFSYDFKRQQKWQRKIPTRCS